MEERLEMGDGLEREEGVVQEDVLGSEMEARRSWGQRAARTDWVVVA
jgi:hypothetical protein